MTSPYERIVRFADTDAAGVVYFAQVLSMAHEAYEAALAAHGIDLRSFFAHGPIVVPIVHASVDLRRPMHCGDRLQILATPQRLAAAEFQVHYTYAIAQAPATAVATALTRHVCISPQTRQRLELPEKLAAWVDQANENISQ